MSLPISLKVGIHNDSYFTKEHKDALPTTPGALYVSCFEDVKGYLYYDNGTNFINIVPRLLGEENGGAGIDLTTIPAYSTLIQGASGTLSSVQSKAGVYFSTGENELPQFGVVPVKYGGTGLTSHTTQGVLYAKNENTLATSGTFLYNGIPGTATQVGENQLILGNNIASGTEGNGHGTIKLFGNSKGSITFRYSTTATEDVVAMYPAYDGNVTISMNTVHDVEDKITTFYLPFYVNANQRLSYNTGLYCMSQAGTTAQNGVSYLCIGNGTTSGSKNNKYGILRIFTTGTAYQNLRATGSTSRTTYLRDHGANAYLVSTPADGTAYGSETLPVYVNTNGMITACKGSSIFGALSWVAGTSNGPTLKATIAGYERTATIPSASASASGIVTTADQTFKGVKTFDAIKLISNDGKTSTITYSDKTSSVSVNIPAYDGNVTISMTAAHDVEGDAADFYLPFYVNASQRLSYNTGLSYKTQAGTTTQNGVSYLCLGNKTASGSKDNKFGILRIFTTGTSYQDLKATGSTSRTTYLRDHGADAYIVGTPANGTAYGSASLPVYVNTNGMITACTGSSVFGALSWAAGTSNGPTLKLTVAGYERTAVIPSASTSASGIVTTGNQAFKGVKTFDTIKLTSADGKTSTITYSDKTSSVSVDIPAYNGNITISMTDVHDTSTLTSFALPFYVNDSKRISYNDGINCMTRSGTTSEEGASYIKLGNATAAGVAGNKYGAIRLYASDASFQNLRADTGAENRTTYLRDHGENAYVVSTGARETAYGSASLPVYVNERGLVKACTGSSIFSSLSWAGGDANGPTLKLTVAGHERTAAIPSASATASGIVTTGNQTFSGEKTFSTVKATTFTGDLEGAAKVAKALRVALTNPAESTVYYPTFVSGTAEGTNFTPRVNDGLRYISTEGTASANGAGILTVGNSIGEGTAGNKRGAIRIYALDTTYCQLRALKGSSNTYSTYLRDHGCSAYNVSAETTSAYGGASTPVYVNANGLITTCSGAVVTESAQSFKGFKTWINGSIWRMTNDLVKGTAPATRSENYVAFCDKNGSAAANRIGMLHCETSTTNINRFTMFAYKPESGVTTNASFSIYYPASGVAYAITSGVEYLKTKRFAVYDASYGTAEPAAADGLIPGQIYFKII